MRTVNSLTLLAMLLPAVAASSGAEAPLDQLRLDHAAWEAADRDFHARRESGTLAGAEASEYAAYVARLKRRVAEDCVAVADAGLPVPSDMSCPALTAVALPRAAAIDQAAEQTREERIAGLDAEFTAGLGEFDERLLRAQERVKAKAATSRSGSGGGGGAGNGGGAQGSGGTTSTAPDVGASEPPQGGNATGSATGAGGGPVRTPSPGARGAPPGTPDGSDDDLVARQLREAAEKETDPELQKKLWEEYRKYKQGTR